MGNECSLEPVKRRDSQRQSPIELGAQQWDPLGHCDHYERRGSGLRQDKACSREVANGCSKTG